MTDQQTSTVPAYRAGWIEQDATLFAPTGQPLASFVSFDDAVLAANAINNAAADADALATAAQAIRLALTHWTRQASQAKYGQVIPIPPYVVQLLEQAETRIDAAPGRAVGAISTGHSVRGGK